MLRKCSENAPIMLRVSDYAPREIEPLCSDYALKVSKISECNSTEEESESLEILRSCQEFDCIFLVSGSKGINWTDV